MYNCPCLQWDVFAQAVTRGDDEPLDLNDSEPHSGAVPPIFYYQLLVITEVMSWRLGDLTMCQLFSS